MFKKLLASLALALGLGAAQAQPLADWSNTDRALLAAGATLHIIDWGQTRYIVKNPGEYKEYNPWLGDHPSMGTVNAYMLGTLFLFPALAEYFPEYRTWILGFWVASRAAVVGNNYSIGIRMSW